MGRRSTNEWMMALGNLLQGIGGGLSKRKEQARDQARLDRDERRYQATLGYRERGEERAEKRFKAGETEATRKRREAAGEDLGPLYRAAHITGVSSEYVPGARSRIGKGDAASALETWGERRTTLKELLEKSGQQEPVDLGDPNFLAKMQSRTSSRTGIEAELRRGEREATLLDKAMREGWLAGPAPSLPGAGQLPPGMQGAPSGQPPVPMQGLQGAQMPGQQPMPTGPTTPTQQMDPRVPQGVSPEQQAQAAGQQAMGRAQGPQEMPLDRQNAMTFAAAGALVNNPQATVEQQASAWARLGEFGISIPVDVQQIISDLGLSEEQVTENIQAALQGLRGGPQDALQQMGPGPLEGPQPLPEWAAQGSMGPGMTSFGPAQPPSAVQRSIPESARLPGTAVPSPFGRDQTGIKSEWERQQATSKFSLNKSEWQRQQEQAARTAELPPFKGHGEIGTGAIKGRVSKSQLEAQRSLAQLKEQLGATDANKVERILEKLRDPALSAAKRSTLVKALRELESKFKRGQR